jgi:hypothetical protein
MGHGTPGDAGLEQPDFRGHPGIKAKPDEGAGHELLFGEGCSNDHPSVQGLKSLSFMAHSYSGNVVRHCFM